MQHFADVPGGWSSRTTSNFANSDFAAAIYAIFGPPAWVACGFHFTYTAHFSHDSTVYGYADGGRNRAWNDRINGACIDLVHHAEWDDYGNAA